ncbi:MAG: phosphate ABC transporter permease PstA [Bacillota bacterium]
MERFYQIDLRKIWDWLMVGLCALSTFALLAILFCVLGYIALQGISGLSMDFFTKMPVPVGLSGGGAAHAVAGSLVMVGLACILGVPWGVAVGVFLAEYEGSRLGDAVRFTADVLTGMPSITAGIFIYTLVVVEMQSFSALAGGLALSIVIMPVVARNTEEILRLIPRSMREAALALGIPEWRVILHIVLPTAARGIGIGVTLALAGIAGDPVPLFFTALNNHYWSLNITQPMASLPMEIFRYATAPFAAGHKLAWTGSIALIGLVIIPMLAARILMPGYKIRR